MITRGDPPIDESVLKINITDLHRYVAQRAKDDKKTIKVPDPKETPKVRRHLEGLARSFLRNSLVPDSSRYKEYIDDGDILGISSHKLSMMGTEIQEGTTEVKTDNTLIQGFLRGVVSSRELLEGDQEKLLSSRYEVEERDNDYDRWVLATAAAEAPAPVPAAVTAPMPQMKAVPALEPEPEPQPQPQPQPAAGARACGGWAESAL